MAARARAKQAQVDDDETLFDEAFLAKLELLHVIARRLFRGRQRAERKTRKIGSGLEFADHREYSPGDDIRYLDWTAWVRLRHRLIRLFEEDEAANDGLQYDQVLATFYEAGDGDGQ